jgi:hypothetical protein
VQVSAASLPISRLRPADQLSTGFLLSGEHTEEQVATQEPYPAVSVRGGRHALVELCRWASILAGILFFLQGFGLGGVIASFRLVLDLIGFLLFLIFVLVSSVILLTRENALPHTAGGPG